MPLISGLLLTNTLKKTLLRHLTSYFHTDGNSVIEKGLPAEFPSMAISVFYAWQSQKDQTANRYIIREALEKAAVRLEQQIGNSVVIDHASQGVSGSGEITQTLMTKIKASDIFVGDLSIVLHSDGRAYPNSNVLWEYGFALASLGEERCIGVINTGLGQPEDLPFDINHRRYVCYSIPRGVKPTDLVPELVGRLKAEILIALERPLIKLLPSEPGTLAPAARAARDFETMEKVCGRISTQQLDSYFEQAQLGTI
jgi:hypothetical protein